MGCIVNGPGEARKADFGIAGGRGEGIIFAHGHPIKKVPQDRLVDELFAEIHAWLEREGRGSDSARVMRALGRASRALDPGPAACAAAARART